MKTITFTCLLIVILIATPFVMAQEKEGVPISEELIKAFESKDFDKAIELTKAHEKDPKWKVARARAFQERGIERFFAANIKGSISDFDEYLKGFPTRDPYHWQRGLSYYYAGQYEKGVAQFERHQVVNPNDVENAVWHFLCVLRASEGDLKVAQKRLIPIKGDSRIPMKEIHDLFAGIGSVEAVLKAAASSSGDGAEISDQDRNHLCYAHLYLALYYEALGKVDKMKEHISLSAGKYRMDHYMGKAAQVHAKLRGVKIGE